MSFQQPKMKVYIHGLKDIFSRMVIRIASTAVYIYIYIYIKKTTFYLFIFRERGREGEREGEKRQCVVASHVAPTGDLTRNPGMCPDWESNQWPFGS